MKVTKEQIGEIVMLVVAIVVGILVFGTAFVFMKAIFESIF